MKVLLDECVDARLAPHLVGFEARTVHDHGWAGTTNGKLLALAEREYDVFLTIDRNLMFQQHLPRFALAVVLVHAHSNRLADLLALLPGILKVIPVAVKGTVTDVGL
ncbi:MAG: DUF5615 family PIN-like protein [Proteobacteria bacterium]|nr:DUF5615 family PIN-like protein [Pseudomonadota bacterium]